MRQVLFTLVLIFVVPALAFGQSVPVKSIPVAEGDQFLLFPSENMGMGGVGIAVEDRYRDLFVNPATAVNVGGGSFISAPTYYGFGPMNNVANEGSGRTFPVGAFAHRDEMFGGAMIAYQELVPPQMQWCCGPVFFGIPEQAESAISQNNMYVFGLAGATVPGTEWSVGASVFHANLRGLEGVRLLYSQGGDVRQNGSMQQYRVGAYRTWDDGHAAEAVVMHHRFDMTHSMRSWTGEAGSTMREEYDKTSSMAVQLAYRRALQDGWTLGGELVGDWKWHPKIPNYDLMQIPRDPGNTSAYNIGVGLAQSDGQSTFAVDVVYEPIWSHTWANAIELIETGSGSIIRPGEKTIDNQFAFNNAHLRMGLHHEAKHFEWSLGINMHRIAYELDQMDIVADTRRLLDQSWTEWTLSGGLGKAFTGFRLQYMTRLTLGTGRPGIQRPWAFVDRAGFAEISADWIAAPRGPLTLDATKVLSHQVALIVPLTD